MSSRDRSSDIALGGLVVLTFLACIAIANMIGEHDGYQQADYASSDQALAKDGAEKTRRPPGDQSVCRKAKTEKEYELCQAWRSADAAREAADTGWKQFLIGILALFGLGWTVYYTKKAADGARKAAEVAERALVDLEQPQVFIDVSNPGVNLNNAPPAPRFDLWGEFRYRFRNFGRTPAHLVDIKLDYPIVATPNLPPPIVGGNPDRTFPTGVFVAADAPYSETENLNAVWGVGGLLGVNPIRQRLFFMGWFRYRDIFNATYKVGFCFVFDPIGGRWVLTGDNEQYNYARKEPKGTA